MFVAPVSGLKSVVVDLVGSSYMRKPLLVSTGLRGSMGEGERSRVQDTAGKRRVGSAPLDCDVEDRIVARAARHERARLVVRDDDAVQAVVVERREREDAVGAGEHAVGADVDGVVVHVLAHAPAIGAAAHQDAVQAVEADDARERVHAERRIVGGRLRLGEARRVLVVEQDVAGSDATLVGREHLQGADAVVRDAHVARGVVQISVAELWHFHGRGRAHGPPTKAGQLLWHAHRVSQHAALHALVGILALHRTHGRGHSFSRAVP